LCSLGTRERYFVDRQWVCFWKWRLILSLFSARSIYVTPAKSTLASVEVTYEFLAVTYPQRNACCELRFSSGNDAL
jgi:hypothetical protein